MFYILTIIKIECSVFVMLIHKEKNKKTKKNICFNNDSNSQIFVKTKNETTPPPWVSRCH